MPEGEHQPEALAPFALSGELTASLEASRAPVADQAEFSCNEWLRLHDESERLESRWARLEHGHVSRHRTAPDVETHLISDAVAPEMSEIESRLAALHSDLTARLTELTTARATSLVGIAAKLAVAAAVIVPDENEPIHRLLLSATKDLAAL